MLNLFTHRSHAGALIVLALGVLSVFISPAEAGAQEKEQREVRLVAHRGGRFEADENTLPAFETALQAGITGFELDIHRTADGRYVIMHDFEVSRMVDAEGTLEKMTFSEVRALRTRKGNTIPTLDEVLALFSKYPGCYVEFEMKTTREDLYPEDVLAIYAEDVYASISKARPDASTYIFSSFDTRVLKYLRKHHPDVEVMFITSKGNTAETRAIAADIGTKRMACHRARTTLEDMRKAHKDGMVINLWPNGTEAEMMLSYYLEADYICTDIPRAACGFIDEGKLPVRK
ncbi:MAG: glycerophosphodiester phosphodiesterase [Bacteroidales bacterium]|nr:glycerophosphodiester phosphodiesterase [Bacteroidales bacterium]